MKHKGKVGILHITDIHFGHNKVSAESIANSIMTMILDNDKDISKNIDLIILGGDEFDDLLTADSEDFQYAIKFFIFLSKYCSKNKIKIRCVEGTNSHSYGQMKTIGPIIETDSNCDFKYVDRLDIEYIPDLDINVLYIPDELNDKDASITMKETNKLLKSKNLDKVDIAITHLYFSYQLPMVKTKSAFPENEMLDIVKHYLYNGHVHTHSVYDRLITTGTPERLKHGEEEDKGILYSIIDLKNRDNDFYKFIKNKFSRIFKTIRVYTDSLLELREQIKKELKSIPKDSFIRLHVDDNNDVIKNNLLELKKTFKHYIFTEEKISKSKISVMDNKLLEKKIVETINIDKNNIIPLILEKVGDKIKGQDLIELEKELKALL